MNIIDASLSFSFTRISILSLNIETIWNASMMLRKIFALFKFMICTNSNRILIVRLIKIFDFEVFLHEIRVLL